MEELNLKSILKRTGWFLVPYLAFLIISTFFLLFYPKDTSLLWLNERHSAFFNTFFAYATNIGDGFFTLAVVIILIFINLRYSIFIFFSFLTSGLFVQILKYIVDEPRPMMYFSKAIILNFVPGVEMYGFNSFPSGHTASAFSLFFLLTLMFKKKYWGVIFFCFALAVGISRIYLLQHFLIDVVFGSLTGLLTTMFLVMVLNKTRILNSTSTTIKKNLQSYFLRKKA